MLIVTFNQFLPPLHQIPLGVITLGTNFWLHYCNSHGNTGMTQYPMGKSQFIFGFSYMEVTVRHEALLEVQVAWAPPSHLQIKATSRTVAEKANHFNQDVMASAGSQSIAQSIQIFVQHLTRDLPVSLDPFSQTTIDSPRINLCDCKGNFSLWE